MGDDPFAPNAPMALTYRQQTEMMADFFDRYLKDKPGQPVAKSVRYYVIGAGRWRTSATWPPANATPVRWYPDTAHALSRAMPASGSERYAVDFAATTGPLSGYRGQVDLSKTDYGNRAAADRRLLVYTSAPVAGDVEIAGNPVAHLRLSSSAREGIVIVLLEDVAPDGRVTYVSQGLLNLAHRRLASSAPASSADPRHSYDRADMAPMKPGVAEDIVLGISPIAALIRKGHRLRIAIAGADATNLARVPAQGDTTLTLERGPETYVELPVTGG
jgi:putative CocE/NonD family hydrolase